MLLKLGVVERAIHRGRNRGVFFVYLLVDIVNARGACKFDGGGNEPVIFRDRNLWRARLGVLGLQHGGEAHDGFAMCEPVAQYRGVFGV